MTNKANDSRLLRRAQNTKHGPVHPAPRGVSRTAGRAALRPSRAPVPRGRSGAPTLEALRQRDNPAVPGVDEGRLRRPRVENAPLLVRTGDSEVEEEFRELAATWRRETEHLSSTSVFTHPAYQRIIGLGSKAVPFILRDLASTGAQWFWALRAITGENPVRPEDTGDVRRMTEAWLAWGETRALL